MAASADDKTIAMRRNFAAALPATGVGIWVTYLGASHIDVACPLSANLAAADVTYGAVLLSFAALSWLGVLLPWKAFDALRCLLALPAMGVFIWLTVAAFQNSLWSRVHVNGEDGTTACDPSLYDPTAVTVIVLWVLNGVGSAIACCIACCAGGLMVLHGMATRR